MNEETREALEELAAEMEGETSEATEEEAEAEDAAEDAAEEEAEAEDAAEDAAEEEAEAEDAAEDAAEAVDYSPRLDGYDSKLDAIAEQLAELARKVSAIVLAGGGNVATEEAVETAQENENDTITADELENLFRMDDDEKGLI